MALPSGRVGVARSEVDANGKLKESGSGSNIELRYDTETDKPQYREKGTEEWLNFSGGGVPTVDLGFNTGKNIMMLIEPNNGYGMVGALPNKVEAYKDVGRTELVDVLTGDDISAILVKNVPLNAFFRFTYYKDDKGLGQTLLNDTRLGTNRSSSDTNAVGYYSINGDTGTCIYLLNVI